MSNTRNCAISTPSKNKVDMSTVLIGRNLAFGSFQSRNANLRRKPVKVALNRMKQRNRLNIEQKVVPTTCAPHTVLRLCFVGNYTMVPCWFKLLAPGHVSRIQCFGQRLLWLHLQITGFHIQSKNFVTLVLSQRGTAEACWSHLNLAWKAAFNFELRKG